MSKRRKRLSLLLREPRRNLDHAKLNRQRRGARRGMMARRDKKRFTDCADHTDLRRLESWVLAQTATRTRSCVGFLTAESVLSADYSCPTINPKKCGSI